MGALKVLRSDNYISTLSSELSCSKFLGDKKHSLIEGFLQKRGIYSLMDVTIEDVIDFTHYIKSYPFITDGQKGSYASALETAVRCFLESKNEVLRAECSKALTDKNKINKLVFFLSINQIGSISDITALLRKEFEAYLVATDFGHVLEYVKAFDVVKQYAIESEYAGLKKPEFAYAPTLMFLAYHPNPAIAKSYSYTQVKDPLFFDFSLAASDTLKRQVFSLLKYYVEEKANETNHYRIQHFIMPLWHFYNYCISENITDVNMLSSAQVDGFRNYISSITPALLPVVRHIVTSIRKFVFLNASTILWDANVWYLERFAISVERLNPSNPIESISFDDILIEENKALLKSYMRYLIGLAPSFSMQSARSNYYYAKQFLSYCDNEHILLVSLAKEHLEKYMQDLANREIKPQSYNSNISGVASFISYLETKELISPVVFPFEYYRAKECYLHKDISVPKDDVDSILSILGEFPEHLRLMYLNLWCIGLRVNEVCVIKGDAYSYDGETAWFLIYQNKAKGEKRIPIPYELYELMTDYIRKNHIGKSEYVFKSSKEGQPYRTGTFCKQIKELLAPYGLTFRSHGYRHTMATDLYMAGCNIQSIREYLGHSSEDMTKHYIDHLPNKIDKQNEEYFSSHEVISWQDT